MIFLTFALGGDCVGGLSFNAALSNRANTNPTGEALSWGIGLGIGAWISGGVSGGHMNPAVTLAMAVFRGFRWKKVPGYILAQILGAMFAALIVYGCVLFQIPV